VPQRGQKDCWDPAGAWSIALPQLRQNAAPACTGEPQLGQC